MLLWEPGSTKMAASNAYKNKISLYFLKVLVILNINENELRKEKKMQKADYRTDEEKLKDEIINKTLKEVREAISYG